MIEQPLSGENSSSTTVSNAMREAIQQGRTALGIELGSTRIKAVLIGPDHQPIAAGSHTWENTYRDRTWTYSLEAMWAGVQDCYATLVDTIRRDHGLDLTIVGALGVSAMMHGYLPFDRSGTLLTPFRTWRNTNTGPAVEILSKALQHNIPHRWSVAHLYQAILDKEDHVPNIAHLTTLAGYMHWQLSGQQVLGVGDASGMFPIDTATGSYDHHMLDTFDGLTRDGGQCLRLSDLLPRVLSAGEPAGRLTDHGARRLDPTGRLHAGAPMCPPEGDAGTGMVATNSVAPRTGNVSAGTSIFAMIVLDQPLHRMHPELDLVTTPAGHLAAMVHCNNGASELDAWAGIFAEFAEALGADCTRAAVFETLLRSALTGAPDCDGLIAFNYLAGEPITDVEQGRPLLFRTPGSRFDLGTFIRAQLFSSLATLRIGMDVLTEQEAVPLDRLFAHGGLFKTAGIAQGFLAAALNTTVSVGDIAGEGGAWGIAVLAAFLINRSHNQSLADYLDEKIFDHAQLRTVAPDPVDVAGFSTFMDRFKAALPVQRAAVAFS